MLSGNKSPRSKGEHSTWMLCVVFPDLCNRVSASVPVNGLPADRCFPEQRFSGGWVVVQQQEGPHIPAGQAKLSHACRLQRSGRQTGWGTSQGRDVRGVTFPADTVFVPRLFSWGWYLDIISISLSAFVPNKMRLGLYVCMLNCLFLGDGDIWAANYYIL